MRVAQLDERSIIELRAIAQGMGVGFGFGDNKLQLINKINDYMDAKAPAPVRIVNVSPADDRLSYRPPRFVCTQDDILSICGPFIERGLKITFPADDQWHMTFGRREDSGTMRMPLLDVKRCAGALTVFK